jgi:hypothetical protein
MIVFARPSANMKAIAEGKAMFNRVMHRLQKMPDIVASFFHAPICAYAKI